MSTAAKVTYVIAPFEHSTLLAALDHYKRHLEETIKNMAPSDGRALKVELLTVNELVPKLRGR